MTIKIIVFVKQVPDTTDIKWTEQNTIQREGLDSIINPFDVGAIQLALNLKTILNNAEIIAATMGPKQAISTLKETLAMGCDKAYLISDKKFMGSDTLATANVLCSFIKEITPDYNFIICGHQAIDGDTAQTPSMLAELLNIPEITSVVALKDVDNKHVIWIKDTCDENQHIEILGKHLITTTLKNVTILPKISGYMKAQDAVITELNADEINVNPDKIGFKGSPTIVKSAYRPTIKRETVTILDEDYAKLSQLINIEFNKINQNKVKND